MMSHKVKSSGLPDIKPVAIWSHVLRIAIQLDWDSPSWSLIGGLGISAVSLRYLSWLLDTRGRTFQVSSFFRA